MRRALLLVAACFLFGEGAGHSPKVCQTRGGGVFCITTAKAAVDPDCAARAFVPVGASDRARGLAFAERFRVRFDCILRHHGYKLPRGSVKCWPTVHGGEAVFWCAYRATGTYDGLTDVCRIVKIDTNWWTWRMIAPQGVNFTAGGCPRSTPA